MKRHFPLLLSVILLIAACKSTPKSEAIRIVKKNFESEISGTQNLIFTFNENLGPDSLLMQWISADYLLIDPPVEGKFRWNEPNTLEFSPLQPFPSATEFTLRLNKSIAAAGSSSLPIASDASISFQTLPLRLLNASVYWNADLTSGQPALQAKLKFNAPVEPGEVSKLVGFKRNDKRVKSRLVSEARGAQMVFALEGVPKDEEASLDVEVKPGLKASGGNLATIDRIFFTTEVPSPDKLEVRYVESDHNGKVGRVKIVFTQAVDPAKLKQQLKLKPAVKFEVEEKDNSIMLSSSEFNLSTNYSLNIASGMEGRLGGTLKEDFDKQFAFGTLQPSIKFSSNKGIYLGASGARNIGVEITAIDEVDVEIYKIYENNLIAFGQEGRRYRWHYDYEMEEGYEYYSYNTGGFGDLIWEGSFKTAAMEKNGHLSLLNVDFSDKVEQFKGTYLVKVSAPDRFWLSDMRMVAVSDIGLIARTTPDEVLVFANSINSADALAGVKLNFISHNNQLLGTTTTDGKGVARFSIPEGTPESMFIGLVTASIGADYNFLMLQNNRSTRTNRVTTSRYEVGGLRTKDLNYDAYLYGERNLFRPGDKGNFAGIVRTTDWELPGKQPVKIKVSGPDGKEWKMIKRSLDDQGAFECQLEFPKSAATGTYRAELYTSNDIMLTSYRFSVEEFVPDKIKVNLNVPEKVKLGNDFTAAMEVMNLYGTPAANRNCELEFKLRKRGFSPKDLPGYNFYIEGSLGFSSKLSKATTDTEGKATVDFKVPSRLADHGVLSGSVMSTAFDETGRPVYKSSRFTVNTQQVMYGIGDLPYYTATRRIVDIPFIALDMDEQVLSGQKAAITIIRYEYQTVLENNNGRFRYRSKRKERVLLEDEITVSGENTTYAFNPKLSGRYEVRISRPGADTYVARKFYAYGWHDTNYSSFEVDNEGEIDIVTDKASYNVNDRIDVLFKAPFDGKLMVTVERDRVIDYFQLDTRDKSATLSFDLPVHYTPNVYISATLIRPEDNLGIPLTVAHGIKPVQVLNERKRIPIEITAPEITRSSQKQAIKVKTKPGAQVTLAVVDEGILQVSGMSSPDAYDHFYRKRALEVNGFDVFSYLYPELTGGAFAGGDGPGGSLRLNPVEANRFKLVSFWSGIQEADRNGNYTFEVDLPKFSGALRIMAVAWEDDHFGGADTEMKVADPIVLTAGLPRFLSPGDIVSVPITLANTTEKDAKGKVNLSVSGPLRIVGSAEQSFEAKAKREARVIYQIETQQNIGKAVVNINASALGENFPDEIEIPVRPASGLQKRTGGAAVQAGEQQVVAVANDFIPGTGKSNLLISNSPLVQLAHHMDYLVQYPHGCVEQTISRAFPQLYFAELNKAMRNTQEEEINLTAHYHVSQAISKLESMQNSDGGLSYWPRSGQASWWGTIYATHFLYEAKQKGHVINERQHRRMVEYLRRQLKQKKTERIYLGNSTSKEVAPREALYSIYVLALMDKADIPSMNYYKARPDKLTADGKYLLATAYALAGDYKRFNELLPNNFAAEDEKPVFGGSFSSSIRAEALALNALLEAEPDHIQIPSIARHLSKQLQNKRYLNTQERSFSLLALGKIAIKSAGDNATAKVIAGGETIGTFNGNDLSLTREITADDNITIEAAGQGAVYAFWETSGITKDGSFTEEDSYLRVRRTFYNRYGAAVDLDKLSQNDLLVVGITLSATVGSKVENVAVTDVIPAGFEIENSRLREIPDFDWIKNESRADYVDIRDDRINIYATAYGTPRTYYYAVRAVSPGTYKMGPVMADAMYNGEYHSYHGAGTVTIK